MKIDINDKDIEDEVNLQFVIPDCQKVDGMIADEEEKDDGDADGLFGSDEDDSD